MKPLSVQLYSLREKAKDNPVGVLKTVAEIGFKGIELAGFYNLKPSDFKKITDDLGLVVSSTHSPWAKPDNVSEVIDVAKTLGTSYVGCGFGRDNFASLDAIRETADVVQGMVEPLRKEGLTLFIHNHAWEFEMVDGRIAYDYFAEWCPDVQFEIDTYWAANFGGNNPSEQVAKFRNRTPLLHIKDGPLTKDSAMVALGTGKMDIPSVIEAADPTVVQWIIVELDRCESDMVTAISESYCYLTENGLAAGNK